MPTEMVIYIIYNLKKEGYIMSFERVLVPIILIFLLICFSFLWAFIANKFEKNILKLFIQKREKD